MKFQLAILWSLVSVIHLQALPKVKKNGTLLLRSEAPLSSIEIETHGAIDGADPHTRQKSGSLAISASGTFLDDLPNFGKPKNVQNTLGVTIGNETSAIQKFLCQEFPSQCDLPMAFPYSAQNVLLVGIQAALVALPGAGLPAYVLHFAFQTWFIALAVTGLIAVGVLATLPAAASALAWLAVIFVPLLAAVALGWAIRGARTFLVIFALPLVAVAFSCEGTSLGQLAAMILSAFSCVSLARVIIGAMCKVSRDGNNTLSSSLNRLLLLRAVIVAVAVLDAALVLPGSVREPYENLYNTSGVIPHSSVRLPRFQVLTFQGSSIGYGDAFWAGVVGATLAAEGYSGRLQAAAALVTFTLSLTFDLLFAVFQMLPATVPLAVAVLIFCDWPNVTKHLLRNSCIRSQVQQISQQPDAQLDARLDAQSDAHET